MNIELVKSRTEAKRKVIELQRGVKRPIGYVSPGGFIKTARGWRKASKKQTEESKTKQLEKKVQSTVSNISSISRRSLKPDGVRVMAPVGYTPKKGFTETTGEKIPIGFTRGKGKWETYIYNDVGGIFRKPGGGWTVMVEQKQIGTTKSLLEGQRMIEAKTAISKKRGKRKIR